MKFQNLIQLFLLGMVLVAASCVSPQQYDALLKENEFLEEENNVLREEVSFTDDDHLLEGKLEGDVTRLENELRNLKKQYATLEKDYKQLTTKYNLAVRENGGIGSNGGMQADLASMQRTIDQQNRELRVTQLTLQEKERKIKDLERLLYGQGFSN